VRDQEKDSLADIADGLADRTRTLLRALDRQDRLETAQVFVGWLAGAREDDRLSDAVREMLLRALKVASDPVNFQILERLDPIDSVELPVLMDHTGLGRVALSERVHDLVQTGLAAREMIGDQVRSTSLASGFLTVVREISCQASEQLEVELRPQASDG